MSKSNAKPQADVAKTEADSPAAASAADVSVYFDTPGVKRIGRFKPNTTYTVPQPEADRLVKVKGFKLGEPPASPAKQEG